MIDFTNAASIVEAVNDANQFGIQHITNGVVTVAIRNNGDTVFLTESGPDGRNECCLTFGDAVTKMEKLLRKPDPTIRQQHRDIIAKGQKTNKALSKEFAGKWVAYRQVEISYWVGDSMVDEKEFCQWSKFTPSFMRKMLEQCPQGARMNVYVAFDVYDSFADYMSHDCCGYDACVDGFDSWITPKK